MIKYTIHLLFATYTFMLMARLVLSWFPNLYQYRIVHFLVFYTDPYLNIFRRIIPPIGGMLDLSPILGFFALRLLERFILGVL